MAQKMKSTKMSRNANKCARYRQNNNRKRHRGAEYRVRNGIGNGYVGTEVKKKSY